MRSLLVYVDTSVFGGLFDPEFEAATRRFFQLADAGRFRLAVSRQVDDEIAPAPAKVKRFFDDSLPGMEYIGDSPETLRLADLYFECRAVGKNSLADALHVAHATIHKCDGLISWNYKHIVHPNKSALFNVVNLTQGYGQLFIATPEEVTDP
jgi:predicted nucleic acid-binding protein